MKITQHQGNRPFRMKLLQKGKKKKTEESEPQKSEDIRNIRFKVQNMFQEIKKTKE